MKPNILQDILIFGGIGLVTGGLWTYGPGIALTVAGLMIGGLGIASFFIRK